MLDTRTVAQGPGDVRAPADAEAALSDYDTTVPAPPPDDRLAQRFRLLRELRQADPAALRQIRDVVLVVSSSRGGSTLLAEVLRRQPGLLGLPGELNPHVTIARLSGPGPDRTLAAELAADIGAPTTEPDLRELVLQARWRLTAQWPDRDLDPATIERAVARAARTDFARPDAPAAFTHRVLHDLGRHARLDPRRYDGLGPLRAAGPQGPPHTGPVVEMPPFRLLAPWRRATADDLIRRTLVIATPRNSYRIEFLAGLFPAARVRVLHLVRDPAAVVNGLIDGWSHPGFFNCPVPCPLSIDGYTDPRRPWTRTWWKFDVPPHWRELVTAPLPQLCAAQWASAHEAVLEAVARTGLELRRVHYEDLVGTPPQRAAAADALAGWLGLGDAETLVSTLVRGLQPLMATHPPQLLRWRRRADEILPVLRGPRFTTLAEELGYAPAPGSGRSVRRVSRS